MGTNHSFQSHSKIQNTQCSMEFGISFGVNYTQKTIAKTEMSSGISMGFGHPLPSKMLVTKKLNGPIQRENV